MKVFFASDHAGFELKQKLVAFVRGLGHEIEDVGAHVLDPDDDYPDFVTPLAKKVAEENTHGGFAATRGIIIGKSGQGEAMAANRIPGARAAVFYAPTHVGRTTSYMENGVNKEENGNSDDIIRLAREHNDANILSLGAQFVSSEEAEDAAKMFLETPFSSSPRHVRRLAKF